MKRVINCFFIFIIIFITGCSNNSSSTYIQSEKLVRDNEIINNLTSQIKELEKYSITLDLYYKGSGTQNDYSEVSYINNKRIISYIDRVSTMYNYYYVVVYAGIINGDEVYTDFNENNLFELLTDENRDSYEINEDEKIKFTKFRYKFEKNYEGKYKFVEFKKI